MKRKFLTFCQTIHKKPKLLTAPCWLGLEITTRCNSKCRTCPWLEFSKDLGKNRELNFNKFKYIIDKVQPKILSLTGAGENLLNKDYCSMIKYARKKKITVYSTTNGLLLNKYAKQIIESDLNELIISLDGCDASQYKEIRRINGFDVIIQGMEKMIFFKRKYNSKILLGINVVIQDLNYEMIGKFLEFAKTYKIDLINFLPLDVHCEFVNNEKYVKNINELKLKQHIKKNILLAKQYNLSTNLSFWDKHFDYIWKKIHLKKDELLTNFTCHNPWSSVFINSAGDVIPCCVLITGTYNYGNIFENDINIILNSKKAIKFREKLIKGLKPFIRCNECLVVSFYDILFDMLRRKLII
ncbi:radical SAM superfamily protein [Candidatus Magnetomorum sp. HK-1]|nr:radical SAM superfamily protein [Candidatus Magnetomorum sp. HK-1]